MFYCHLSAFSRQFVNNDIIISRQYTLIIRLTIAIVHSIVSRIMLLFQFDYLIKSPLVSMLCSCHAFGMLVPRLWHDCDKPLAQLCHAFGTTVPSHWHDCASTVAQLCQAIGTTISNRRNNSSKRGNNNSINTKQQLSTDEHVKTSTLSFIPFKIRKNKGTH